MPILLTVFRHVASDPERLDRQVLANSGDLDQTRSTLFAILSASFGHITVKLYEPHHEKTCLRDF